MLEQIKFQTKNYPGEIFLKIFHIIFLEFLYNFSK